MHPALRAGLIFGKCILLAGVSFILYRHASKAAVEAGTEAVGLFSRLMITSTGEESLAAVVDGGVEVTA